MTFEGTFFLFDAMIKAKAFVEFIKAMTAICFMK